jgi:hypothetical protein
MPDILIQLDDDVVDLLKTKADINSLALKEEVCALVMLLPL